MEATLTTKTIREIALDAPATTRVFEKFKIDYCCGGRRSIADACEAEGIDSTLVYDELDKILKSPVIASGEPVPELMKPSALVDYIVGTHHSFTTDELIRLKPLAEKVTSKHGESHPELLEILDIFVALQASLLPHMWKEESVLFPYIKQLEVAAAMNAPRPMPHFGTVMNPIKMMMQEHDADGERLHQMRKLSADYTLPEGACPSYTALYAGLEDLERDLHRHIHLENNVLFPAAAELEQR